MTITGTHIAYYHLCHRKLWLFAHGIQMEHTSDLVAEGKLIDSYSYPQRAQKWQQIELPGIKIDHYDPQNGIIREVKKSNKREQAHIAQLKYYLYVMESHDIPVQYGLLEYPKLRETDTVYITDVDRDEIPKWVEAVQSIIAGDICPGLIQKSLCKRCAYYDFCYSTEEPNQR